MSRFGLQQYYVNSQQNRAAADEAAKQREFVDSQRWKDVARSVLGGVAQTGLNIGQTFAADQTPTRQLAREVTETTMRNTAEDRDRAAKLARATAAMGMETAQDPYGDGTPALEQPRFDVLADVAPPNMSVAPPAPMRQTPNMSVAPPNMSVAPPAPMQQAPQVAPTAPGRLQPTSFRQETPHLDMQRLKSRALDSLGLGGKGFSPDDIAIAEQAAAGAMGQMRGNQAAAAKSAFDYRTKGVLPILLKSMDQKTEIQRGGKHGAKVSYNPYTADLDTLTRMADQPGFTNPLQKQAMEPPAPVFGGNRGPMAPDGKVREIDESGKYTGRYIDPRDMLAQLRAQFKANPAAFEGVKDQNHFESIVSNPAQAAELYINARAGNPRVGPSHAMPHSLKPGPAGPRPVRPVAPNISDLKMEAASLEGQLRQIGFPVEQVMSMSGGKYVTNTSKMQSQAPEVQELAGRLVKIHNEMRGRIKQYNNDVDTFRSGAGYGGRGGAPAPSPASGPQEGDTATDRNGTPLVFRGGKWEAQ